jgi:hypothetical protein
MHHTLHDLKQAPAALMSDTDQADDVRGTIGDADASGAGGNGNGGGGGTATARGAANARNDLYSTLKAFGPRKRQGCEAACTGERHRQTRLVCKFIDWTIMRDGRSVHAQRTRRTHIMLMTLTTSAELHVLM